MSTSTLLAPIIFANDTSYSPPTKIQKFHSTLFNPDHIQVWFNADKLSPNNDKTKFSFFHKFSKKDDV